MITFKSKPEIKKQCLIKLWSSTTKLPQTYNPQGDINKFITKKKNLNLLLPKLKIDILCQRKRVNTLKVQLIFPSKPNFCIFFVPTTKFGKNQYLQHLNFENCEINSIKSKSSRTFQQHKERPNF
jgi:hypothetical protein